MSCLGVLVASVAFPLCYLASIYVAFDHSKGRNHLRNVRLRFVGAIGTSIFAVAVTYWLLCEEGRDSLSLFRRMGFRLDNVVSSILLPTFLTAIFYFGTFISMCFDENIDSDLNSWILSVTDIYWLRLAVVAPVTEEIAFRACSATLFRHCFGHWTTIFVSPTFFALCHFHHIFEDCRFGLSLFEATAKRGFQAFYTYLFGAYATYLQLHTGNVLAPILSHSLCNSLGIPNVFPYSSDAGPLLRLLLPAAHFLGFALWILFMPTLVNPHQYSSVSF